MTPKQRGARALNAVKTYGAYDGYDLRAGIVDLVADLLHLADRKHLQHKYNKEAINLMHPEQIIETARGHFLTERRST
jgi:hypothetical protein